MMERIDSDEVRSSASDIEELRLAPQVHEAG
jgi:hypothetical protein